MLTYESILSLPPGRELDALIEEHCFNRRVTRNWPCMVNGDDGSMMVRLPGDRSRRCFVYKEPTTGRGYNREVVPEYSTAIDQAMALLEKRRMEGNLMSVSAQEDGYCVQYRVHTRSLSCGTDLAAAICRVILLDLYDL